MVGYGDERRYPLADYWRAGLPPVLCSDNPAISRTTMAEEFLRAAQFWPALTLWEVLALIKQSFLHAFLPAAKREQVLREVDHEMYRRITSEDAVPIGPS